MTGAEPRADRQRWTGYLLLVVAAACLVGVIQYLGHTVTAPLPPTAVMSDRRAAAGASVLQVLLALAAVVGMARACGGLARRVGQPAVIGEIVAGLLIGPSCLGWMVPTLSQALFQPAVLPGLSAIATLGIVVYLFLVGVELDPARLRQAAPAAVTIALAGIAVPFVVGTALSLGLYLVFGTANVAFTTFALFIGVATAITAFPVLARILTDQQLERTPLGQLALTCAGIGDATAWVLLAIVVGMAQRDFGAMLRLVGGALAYLGVMVWLVRPWLRRIAPPATALAAEREPCQGSLIVGLLLSAAATEAIGLHALFGAFLFGVLVPADSAAARLLETRWRDLATVLLLPVFFALTGLRTSLGLVQGGDQWLWCLALVVAATVGKVGGTVLAARMTGMRRQDWWPLGWLMNTRGLMELVVLNIGLELGIISPTVFAMMVLMAVSTTVLTAPMLRRLGVRSAEDT
jgi:Kef-type K+ transport system membrane component KefB